jgi:periplasmic protein TonB
MSKLNINKTEWLELVFEGKNKEYGAYQLRQEEGKTTAKAFFSAIVFITGLAMLPVLLSSFTDDSVVVKPINHLDDVLKVTDVVLPKKEEQKKIEKQIKKADIIAPKTENLVNPNIVEAKKAPNVDFTKPEDVGKSISNDPLALNGGVNGTPDGTTTKPTPVDTPKGNGETVVSTAVVEKTPMFPGGINAFLRIVGNKFVAPEMDEEKVLKVIVFFIVEKDGSLSNITVPRTAGKALDEEAIRVLKSIKTKWEPGIYNGQPVRTQFSLPIVVQAN